MRKTQLSLLALLMFQFACEPTEDTGPGIDYDQVSDEFGDMFKGAFRLTESIQTASVIDRTKNQLKVQIEVENISKATKNHIAGYFNIDPELNQRTYYPAPPLSSKFSGGNAIQTLDNVIDTSKIFNNIQKMYIKALSKDIAVAESYGDGFDLVNSFRNEVVQASELSSNDKVLLLELAAGSNALLEFMENGGVQMVQSNLVEILGNNIPFGRTEGCSVDWRKVWIGAVVALTVGVVSGAIAGATVGTVTVPILGTAAGAVGGAVFAGAVGFASGALYGIATDLIASCPRQVSLQQTYASCDEAWRAYLSNQTNNMPSECFVVEYQI